MAKRGLIKREGTWHILSLRVFQTAYDGTAGEEDHPANWDWPVLLDKRYEDVELLSHVIDEDQEHHITDWAEDAKRDTGTAGLPNGLDQKLHEILVTDPRGCEHPTGMSPQCERVARRLAFMAAFERTQAQGRDVPDVSEVWEDLPEVRRCPACGIDLDNERHDDCPESAWHKKEPRGRVSSDPDQPLH